MLRQLFGSKLRASALTWLLLHPEKSYYVRQLERLLEADSANLSRELARLEKAGILSSTIEGRQKYYRADPECPVFEELRSLVRKSVDFPAMFRKALRPMLSRIRTAFIPVAGSSAPGEADDALEIVVVGTCSPAEVEAALQVVGEKYGTKLRVRVMGPAQWARGSASGDPAVSGLASRDREYIFGDDDALRGALMHSKLTDAIESWAERGIPPIQG